MSEWESICSVHAKEACAPADAREFNPELLHLYLKSGILVDKNYRLENQTWGRVFPKQGQVTTLNAVPDPSWAGKSRPAAIGGVAVIRTPDFRGMRRSGFFQNDADPRMGEFDTVVLPAGSIEFRLCTTPERTVGVFARIEMVSRNISVDATQDSYDLHRMSFIKIRSGIMSFYDLILTYGVIGTAGTQELLTYYYPALADFRTRFPRDDGYEVPVELGVFQPTQSHDPVAVVRDPATREGFCRVFSCPSFCDTPGDPFVRSFGQIILDGTVGDQETYEAYWGDKTPIDNCYGAARVYMRSAAYNVGTSERNPTGPNWITRPPMMLKPANNASFSYNYSGDQRTESFVASWAGTVVGDHQRTRLTQGLAGITATPTTTKIPAVANDAASIRLSFYGSPPTASDLNLPYRFWSPLTGGVFTLPASADTQNAFFGQGVDLRFYADDLAQDSYSATNPLILASFYDEGSAQAYLDELNNSIEERLSGLAAVTAETTASDLAILQDTSTSAALDFVTYQYSLTADEWLAEAAVYSAGYTATSTTTLTDETEFSEDDHFRYHSPALDIRKNAAATDQLGQLNYAAQQSFLSGAAHFSHKVVRRAIGALLAHGEYELQASSDLTVYRVVRIAARQVAFSFIANGAPVDKQFTTHRSCSFDASRDARDDRVLNSPDTNASINQRLKTVEFLP